METIIEAKGLSKQFGKLLAVDGLELNVFRGDVFGFLGPNGAGKSTTIRMLLGLITPSAGSISLFGKNLISEKSTIMRRVGAIVEKPDFYGYLSAYKNLELLGQLTGADITKKMIFEMLELVGLEKRYNSKVKTFSHGMKQRLGIAQALLHDPELIILDEPTTGLDPQGMKEIRDLIVRLSTEMKKTILLSSHILSEVEIVASRMIIINKGKTIVEGSVSDLLNAAQSEVMFRVSDTERALALLTNYTLSKPTVVTDSISISIRNENISELNALFVRNGIDVQAIIPKRSLEEYFLRITEGKE